MRLSDVFHIKHRSDFLLFLLYCVVIMVAMCHGRNFNVSQQLRFSLFCVEF